MQRNCPIGRRRFLLPTLEAKKDSDREDPVEIIPEESDKEGLAELYMPPREPDSATVVQVDGGWADICRGNKFLIKGPEYFAFPDEYKLVLSAEGSCVTDCPAGHAAIYAHMLDFGLRFHFCQGFPGMEHLPSPTNSPWMAEFNGLCLGGTLQRLPGDLEPFS